MKRFLLIFIAPLSITGCGPQSEKQLDQEEPKEIKEEGLPVYNIDPETFIPREFGIMDLVNEDLEIIRLETCLDCFIGQPTRINIEDEFILVGSIRGMKPGELLLFSRNGDFGYKFGKGGRGPGEHTGYNPTKVRYYPKDSTVLVVWSGAELQLFDISGDYRDEKDQIDLPYRFLKRSIERWSDSLWFATGQDDWASRFGTYTPTDSIRFVLFSQNGEIIKEIRRTNFPSLTKRQEQIFMPYPFPYKFYGNWKFNLYGNDTLFSFVEKNLEPNAILATPTSEFPLGVKVIRETKSFFMLNTAQPIMDDSKDYPVINNLANDYWELEYHKVLIDKSSGKVYSVKWRDDVFFLFDNLNSQNGGFRPVSFRWGDDRLTFSISAAEWMERAKEMDTSKLRPTIREKLKVLEGLSEDDNPIVFTFTLKDEIDFD